MLGNEEEREYGGRGYAREWFTGWRRISWGAILAGTLVTLAIFLTLQLLGAGIGVVTFGGDPTSPSALGVGAAIWWLLTGLLALFVGGWVAGRLAWLPSKIDRILHGLTVWSLFYIVMFWLAATTLGALVGGGISLLTSSVSAAAQAADSPQAGQMLQRALQSVGLNPEVIRQEIAQAVGPQQGQQADDNLVTAIGEYFRGPQTAQERQQLSQQIAQTTGMSQAQADQLINRLETRAQQAAQAGEQAADITGGTLIGLAITMLLGALAAALGGFLATRPESAPPQERRYDTGARAREEAYVATPR